MSDHSNSLIADDSCPAVTTAGVLSSAPGAGAPAVVVHSPVMASEEWSRSAPGQPQPKAPTGGDSRERPATKFSSDCAPSSGSGSGSSVLQIVAETEQRGNLGKPVRARRGLVKAGRHNDQQDAVRLSSCGGDSSPDSTSSEIDDGSTFDGSHTVAAPRSRRAGIASGPQDTNSVVANSDRDAPAPTGVSSLDLSAASSGVADFSSEADLIPTWLLQPLASELPAMRQYVIASRTLAAKASISKSTSLVKA